MKKIILIGFIAFGLNVAKAQTNTATTGQSNEIRVPQSVSSTFSTNYPGITATWGRDGNNYTATYKDQSTNMGRMLTYDKNGTLMYTDMEMNGTNYPTGIDDYYHKNFPDQQYTIWSSDDGKGSMSYYSKGKDGKTSWFDGDGKYSSKRPASKNKTNNKDNKATN